MPNPNRIGPITGMDLRLARVSRGPIRQREVAAAYGVTRERIRAIENAQRPTPRAIARYLAALAAAEAERDGA
jgi:transcriptional regulator with XRE-family HTH domain